MAKKTLILDGFKKGQYMSWFITTQAGNKIKVKLYDEAGNVYLEGSKQSTNIDPPLGQGSAFIKAEKVKIDIESVNANKLETWHNTSYISSATTGKQVGISFLLAGEDYDDEDYNDVYISICAWDKAG
ncbi:MAG: hypothetical protein IJ711_13185 [Lachnospiraceae bacterium]|nr:hypothetical protein [Lachnospiraceae bacterium]